MSSTKKEAKAPVIDRWDFDANKFGEAFKTGSDNAAALRNHYGYLDLGNGLSRSISGFKRITAFANPFALQQGSNNERLGFAPSVNSKWWLPSPLANNVSYGRLGPSHFDATKQANFSPPDTSHAVVPFDTFANLKIGYDPMPVACVRPLQKLYRCRMINGDDGCQREADSFLAQCPNPVLAEMRNEKLTNYRHRQIQLEDYRKAIEVSEYNRGRSVAEVPANADASWGSRHNLRPDTLWADERYANVTAEEIEDAQKRMGELQKRFQARLDPKIQKPPHFDSNKQFVGGKDVPVYAK